MTDTIRSSLVLPPLIASPQTAPRQGESVPVVLDSFQHKYQQRNTASEGHAIGPHTQALPVGASMVSPGASPFGHSPASLGASPAAMPPALLGSSLRPRGKSPERSSEEDPKMHMKVETNSPNGDDIITLFPRRKAGQTRPGGGRGPVVLNLELLEKFYGMPLHVAANRLGICQTAIKKVCRKLGIMKWPYKEMRVPSDRPQERLEGSCAENSDAASDETTSDLASILDTPRTEPQPHVPPAKVSSSSSERTSVSASKGATQAGPYDAEVKAAVTALLSLQSV